MEWDFSQWYRMGGQEAMASSWNDYREKLSPWGGHSGHLHPGGFQGLAGPSPELPGLMSALALWQEGRLGLSQPHLTDHLLILTSWKWGAALNTLNWVAVLPSWQQLHWAWDHSLQMWWTASNQQMAGHVIPPILLFKGIWEALEVCMSLPDRSLTTQSSSVKAIYGLIGNCAQVKAMLHFTICYYIHTRFVNWEIL